MYEITITIEKRKELHMEKTLVFKTATVGGYNKSEVNQYLQSLHEELDTYDQELAELKVNMEEMEIANEETQAELITLKETVAQATESEVALKEELELREKEIKTCITTLAEREKELALAKTDSDELIDAKELSIRLQVEAHATAKRITSVAEAEAKATIAKAEAESIQLFADAQKAADQKKLEQSELTRETINNLFILQEQFTEIKNTINIESEKLTKLLSTFATTDLK